MQRKLTERLLQSLKARASGRLDVADTDAPGLTVRVTANGVKSWAVRYSPKGQGQRRTTIGLFPGLSLADARTKAHEIAAGARRGLDLPAQEARERKERQAVAGRPQTVGELLTRYVEDYCKSNQRRWKVTERLLDQHVRPTLGDKRLSDLRRADLVELLDDLQNEKKLSAQVNRVRSQIVSALNWGIEREYLTGNPAAGIKRRKIEKPRARVLSDDELRAVWKAADALSYPSGPFIKALILTGQRRDEVRGMKRSELQENSAVWVIPAERNKSKREHLVPLAPAVQELLGELPNLGPCVFSIEGSKPYAGQKRLKEILDRKSGVTGWVLHDIRRTVRTRLSALGVSPDVAKRVMNHAKQGLDKVYDVHEYRDEKAKALTAWAERLAIIVSEGRGAPNVVPIRR